MKITVDVMVNAPITDVWLAYTTPKDIMHWNAASDDWHTTKASIDLRVGGSFLSRMEAKDGSFGFDFVGTYTKIIPHHLLEYSFADRVAKVEFCAQKSGVQVSCTFDAETENPIDMQRQGWQAILNNFAKYVEQQV
jgi:uncharacterized protein YndB with AHSA1/START domain